MDTMIARIMDTIIARIWSEPRLSSYVERDGRVLSRFYRAYLQLFDLLSAAISDHPSLSFPDGEMTLLFAMAEYYAHVPEPGIYAAFTAPYLWMHSTMYWPETLIGGGIVNSFMKSKLPCIFLYCIAQPSVAAIGPRNELSVVGPLACVISNVGHHTSSMFSRTRYRLVTEYGAQRHPPMVLYRVQSFPNSDAILSTLAEMDYTRLTGGC